MWFKLFCVFACVNFANCCRLMRCADNPSVKRFQEYLRIDTSKAENLELAVEFWRRQADELGLAFAVYLPTMKPVVVLSWPGTNPSLPSIMLNSHMDVVSVDYFAWKYPPFDAHIDEKGDIYARGAQDTKDVAIQYIEAIRNLKESSVTLARTLHITLMPDEETGGFDGMKPFLMTKAFKDLNIGFALDEGISSATDTLYATYQDKRPWQIRFYLQGEGGHGSSMPDGTAMEKAERLINVIMKFREVQKKIMKSSDSIDFGAYSSVNINMINGGAVPNIIPNNITVVVDIRLATSANTTQIEDLVNSWTQTAGNGTTVEFIRQDNVSMATRLDKTNSYWMTFQSALQDMGIMVKPVVCPATSDMLVLRNHGVQALGFAPKSNTTSRIHGNNEYINVETFLNGVDIYKNILLKLGNL